MTARERVSRGGNLCEGCRLSAKAWRCSRGLLGLDSGRIHCWGEVPQASREYVQRPQPGLEVERSVRGVESLSDPRRTGWAWPNGARGSAGRCQVQNYTSSSGAAGRWGGQGRVPDVGVTDRGTLRPSSGVPPGCLREWLSWCGGS